MKKSVIPFLGYLTFVSTLTIFLFSCTKTVKEPTGTGDKKQGSVYEYIKKLGYKDSEIKDIGDDYLVDGDILFSKKSQPDFSIFSGPKTEQYGTSNYVGYNKQPNIVIYVDPSLSGLSSEVQGAVDMWNNVTNCRINFSITTSPFGYDIYMTDAYLGPFTCGSSYFPMNGQPGPIVQINSSLIAGNSFAQRQRTIAHELGHTIGFRHTDWQSDGEPLSATGPDGAHADAVQILGTPTGTDFSSLMNGGECGIGATTLSGYDIIAVQFLYPENPPVAGTVPVFRYYNKDVLQKHFYTPDYSEIGDGSNSGFIFEGVAFFAFPTQVTNSVGIHRWYNPTTSEHFYTADPNEIPANSTYEGIWWYAYPSAINGSVPVHRYYQPAVSNHFYTKNPNESPSLATSTYEGVGWYAY